MRLLPLARRRGGGARRDFCLHRSRCCNRACPFGRPGLHAEGVLRRCGGRAGQPAPRCRGGAVGCDAVAAVAARTIWPAEHTAALVPLLLPLLHAEVAPAETEASSNSSVSRSKDGRRQGGSMHGVPKQLGPRSELSAWKRIALAPGGAHLCVWCDSASWRTWGCLLRYCGGLLRHRAF